MPPALRKRPVSPASAAATYAHLTRRSSTGLSATTVAPQPWARMRPKMMVSR